MADLLKVLDEFNSLDSPSKRSVIMASLVNGDLSYEDLSKTYVAYLESKSRADSRRMTKAVQWLTSYWHGGRIAKSDFVKAGTAYFIVKNGYMKGAGVESDMQTYLDSHPYEETEDGMPRTELKP